MSNARFWFIPLKDIAPAEQQAQLAAKDEVRASDLPASFNVPSKLHQEGIREGHVLALHDGDSVMALARVLALDGAGSLHWRHLPMLEAPELSATPELREVTSIEAQQFKVGIDAVLRDVPASTGSTTAPSAPAKTYTPTGPASNIILYGPPGTGKTYSVRRRALELIGDANAAKASPSEVKDEWDRLRGEGQIVFCTFHQAFAYEEFVEGLRAETDPNGNVQYKVVDGVFKALARKAAADAGPPEESSFDTLWSRLGDELGTQQRTVKGKEGGDYVLSKSANGNVVVAGAKGNAAKVQTASREVMQKVWSDRDNLGEDPNVRELKGFQTGGAQIWIVYRELRRIAQEQSASPKRRDFVLVIDEINRANIARVFGELITLLEPDKRLGNPNELRVQLPSSKGYIAAFLASEVMHRFANATLFPQAKGQRHNLYLDGQEKVLRMAPDLVFVHETAGAKKTLIIDTKWKRLSDEAGARPSRSDLYQLYAYLHRYDCQRAHLLYPITAGVQTRDFNARGRNDSDAGTVGVRFVDLNRKLWTRESKTALANELALIVREGLGLPEAAPVEATA